MKRLLWLPLLLISCQPCVHAETLHGYDIGRLSEAIYKAEGGIKAKKPYGILSVPCQGKEHCGRICRNTIRNNLKRWHKSSGKGENSDFIEFLGKRYAPVKKGLKNDPRGLNRHWVKNVKAIYGGVK